MQTAPTLDHTITTADALRDLYGEPVERARVKVIDHLDAHCRSFIAASPFVILATGSSTGFDCSPKGDPPSFVQVQDDKTLLVPDRRGNNRIDGLVNLIEDPRVGLIFLVPGVNETLRVNGRATISADPALTGRFEVRGKAPITVLVVEVEEAFLHCAKALVRSDLWNPATRIDRGCLPSTGRILADHTGGAVDPTTYDAELTERHQRELY